MKNIFRCTSTASIRSWWATQDQTMGSHHRAHSRCHSEKLQGLPAFHLRTERTRCLSKGEPWIWTDPTLQVPDGRSGLLCKKEGWLTYTVCVLLFSNLSSWSQNLKKAHLKYWPTPLNLCQVNYMDTYIYDRRIPLPSHMQLHKDFTELVRIIWVRYHIWWMNGSLLELNAYFSWFVEWF